MLHESGLLNNLHSVVWHKNQPLCIYGDPAYPLAVYLQALFATRNLTPNQSNYNKAMSQVRIVVEGLFGEIKTYFKFVSIKSQMKIGLSAVGKMHCVCALLQNAQTCLYGNKVSRVFSCESSYIRKLFPVKKKYL